MIDEWRWAAGRGRESGSEGVRVCDCARVGDGSLGIGRETGLLGVGEGIQTQNRARVRLRQI